jgi:hypothetical protein
MDQRDRHPFHLEMISTPIQLDRFLRGYRAWTENVCSAHSNDFRFPLDIRGDKEKKKTFKKLAKKHVLRERKLHLFIPRNYQYIHMQPLTLNRFWR